MMTATPQSQPCDRRKLFELAKDVYALHCAVNQLSKIHSRKTYREELIEILSRSADEFCARGGIIETGSDIFCESGPILLYPEPKEVIPYEIGRMTCEQLLNL